MGKALLRAEVASLSEAVWPFDSGFVRYRSRHDGTERTYLAIEHRRA